MSDRLNDLLGGERQLVHKGKTYKLSPVTLAVMGRWESYLEAKAWKAMDRRLAAMPAMEKVVKQSAMEQELIADIVAGKYSTVSLVSSKAQQFPGSEGNREMLKIRLEEANEGITEELIDDILADRLEEIERLMKSMDAQDPNSPAPQEAGQDNSASGLLSPDSSNETLPLRKSAS